jgi:Fic family protein
LSYDFVTIHPFYDGNGRLSRLLLNIVLLSMSVPFCSALGYSSGHKKAKSHYFKCIEDARKKMGSTTLLASVVLYSYCAVSATFFEKVRIVFADYYFLKQDSQE